MEVRLESRWQGSSDSGLCVYANLLIVFCNSSLVISSAGSGQIYYLTSRVAVSVTIHLFSTVLHSKVIFLCFLIFNAPTGLLNLEQLLRRFLISKETLSVRMLDDSQDPTPVLKEIRDDKTATIVVDANTTMSHIILERVSVLLIAAASFMLWQLFMFMCRKINIFITLIHFKWDVSETARG